MGGGAWPFLVGGVICLVNSDNERDSNFLTRCRQGYGVETLHALCPLLYYTFASIVAVCQSCYVGGAIPGGLSEQDTCFLNGQIAPSNNEIEQ